MNKGLDHIMTIGWRGLFVSTGVAMITSCFGFVFLITGHDKFAQVLFVYPASVFGYVAPPGLVDHLPEGWLFFIGVVSSVAVWTLVLIVARVVLHALPRRQPAA